MRGALYCVRRREGTQSLHPRTMATYFSPAVISPTSRRAFLLRGGAFIAAAASPGTVLGGIAQNQAHGADFPPLFNSREYRVTPSPAVAVNMSVLDMPSHHFLQETKKTEVSGLLHAVQEYVNDCGYRPGAASEDFAAPLPSPGVLFRDGGDCRDFAVAKYMLLRRFDLAHHDLRLVLLDLPPTRRPRPERRVQTVLAVKFRGKIGILDNFHDRVLPHERMLGCRPLWSLNHYGLWRHSGCRA